jgi:hypothetical protein
MRSRARRLPLVPLTLLVTIALLPLGCEKSDSITGPSTGAVPASVDGTWRGIYTSHDPAGCGSSSATAEFRQDGATVTGTVSTSACGVSGSFRGSVQGSLVTGAVGMAGCVGGGASGTTSGSELVLSIGDLTKTLTAGGEETVMYGGVLTLTR